MNIMTFKFIIVIINDGGDNVRAFRSLAIDVTDKPRHCPTGTELDVETHPNVDFRAGVFLSEEDFGCGVRRRSTPRVQLMLRRPKVAETEIGYLHITLRV